MPIIDFIIVGQDMPKYIPLIQAQGSDYMKIKSRQIQVFDSPCFSFVPYYPDNINYCTVDSVDRDVISCPFTGCLMAIWKKEVNGEDEIRVGHVATSSEKAHDCKELWEDEMRKSKCGYAFKPSQFILPLPPGVRSYRCYGLFTFSDDRKKFTAFSILTESNPQGVPCKVLKKVLVHEGSLV